jgi:N-acetylglucosaminyldiphosphoundecaprenol N-acetyl-beta-D-mannosaminyltransferase
MQSINILGCRVDAIDRAAAVARVAELARGTSPSLVVTLGVEMVMAAQTNAAFRDVVNGAALCVCDTIGLLLASRVRGGPLRERVTGVQLIDDLAGRSATVGDVRLYLLGASLGTAERAAKMLMQRYPGAQIVGTQNGYFTESDIPTITAAIRASGANVLCVGLGSPRQEMWLSEHLAHTGCGVGIGVGGSFDIFAGTVKRAPAIFQRAGLEWAYRLVSQPSRWRRQLALPKFAIAAGREIFMSRTGTSTR